MLKYLQSNIDECETALTYYSVKKDLVFDLARRLLTSTRWKATLLATTAEEAARFKRRFK